MALNSTAGDAAAESFCSVVEADTYWTNHGSPADWTGASTGTKEGALRFATEWLDNTYAWYSSIYSTTQSLGWPRVSYLDSDGRTIGGAGVVPQKIKDATCLMALQYIKSDFTSTDTEGVISESVGSASITYGKSSKSYSFVKMSLKEYGTPSKASSNVIYRA